MSKQHLNIAIDGPAGAGKSTIARALADKLGARYLDTGAMYRAVALLAERAGVDPGDGEAMERILPDANIAVRYDDAGVQHVYLSGEDVTGQLRTNSISMGASMVGLHMAVRRKLTELQRRVAEENDVVMDGRDITTNVLPDTPYKFYLTASVEERARRRYQQLLRRGGTDKTLEEIEREIAARDKNDMERDYMPLRRAEDAVLIDSSSLTIDEVTEQMLRLIREKEKE
ncbi:cytidylate kinase [Clostridium sp. CAG:1024]|nr:(d)CMP kinase [Clostridium sp.]MDD7139998.1 (d)CMP kinase [Clostridium sp.]MDY6081414.1 (d)CMP kinase [Eubacteriales bacterium]CCX43003.1 cytidylate kinase [Clostridium sp. CAG:1024]